MKKALTFLIITVMLFTGCVSSENKKIVRHTLEEYFQHLTLGEFDEANKMTVQVEKEIAAHIEDISVNKLIFEDITYEIWDIYEDGEFLVAETVITQKSLKASYTDAVKEYASYVEDAKVQNKQFTDSALEDKWNEIFYKHVASTKETVSMKCEIKIYVHEDGLTEIHMTSQLRNCLFGGELDAINAISKGEN